jgi:hypothetical protein
MHDKRVSQVYIEVTDELLKRIGDTEWV